MMTMPEIRHLRYFVAVAEELHFGRAAKRLHIVQPALSMQIKALEEELGAQLLLRDHHQVQLSEIGRLFLEQARDILKRTEQSTQLVARALQGEIGRLRIGICASSTSNSIMPNLVKAFHKLHPEVKIELVEVHPAAQAKALLNRNVDVVFGPSAAFSHIEDIAKIYLNHFSFKLACSCEHNLANFTEVDVHSLKNEIFVGLSAEDDQYGMMVTNFALPFIPMRSMQVQSPAALLSVVEANLAVAVLSEALERSAPPNIVFLELLGVDSNMDLFLFCRKAENNPLVERFMALAKQGKNE